MILKNMLCNFSISTHKSNKRMYVPKDYMSVYYKGQKETGQSESECKYVSEVLRLRKQDPCFCCGID